MDTVVEVTIANCSNKQGSVLMEGIDSLLGDWEQRFSQTHERSEILRLNSRDTTHTIVSAQLSEMLERGRAFGDTLEGMFDLTILPVKRLWGFGERDSVRRVPDSTELSNALSRTDYTGIVVYDDTVRIDSPALKVDVGGIAKGFVLREIDRYLRRNGCNDFLVSAGGDILARGTREPDRPWRIGVQNPRNTGTLLATLSLDSGAVVTSGDYERYWIEDGVRYHHIFDPRTGRSCRVNQSLTIWSPDPVAADVLSTGLFCLPSEKVLEFVNARSQLECAGVDSAGTVYISDGWKGRFALSE
jgi:thiamine biosynthesis lipoprotein